MKKKPLAIIVLLIALSTSVYNLEEVFAVHGETAYTLAPLTETMEIPSMIIKENAIKIVNLSAYAAAIAQMKSIVILEKSSDIVDCLLVDKNLLCKANEKEGTAQLKLRMIDQTGTTIDKAINLTIVPAHKPPSMKEIENFTFFDNSGTHQDLINVRDIVSSNDDQSVKWYIADESNPGLVRCYLQKNNFIGCKVNENKTGESTVTIEAADQFTSTKKEFSVHVIQRCRSGTVNGNGELVLFVNEQTGDSNNEMTLNIKDPLTISIKQPLTGPSHPGVVIYAFLGAPTLNTERFQLFRLGTTCFPTALNKNDTTKKTITLFNSLEDDHLFGEPIFTKQIAPFAFNLTQGFRDEKVITIQGFIQDNNAPNDKRIAITNALVLKIKK